MKKPIHYLYSDDYLVVIASDNITKLRITVEYDSDIYPINAPFVFSDPVTYDTIVKNVHTLESDIAATYPDITIWPSDIIALYALYKGNLAADLTVDLTTDTFRIVALSPR